uniref:SCP domain-containing protein n=1 Tax=Plectus sambesii TaxID=2011161 RepID=A0A914XN10_9BILA
MLLPPTVFATQLYRSYWFTPSQQQQIIDSHNELRRLEPAADMQELVWDDALAALAKDHASKCDAWHRDASERRGHGYRYIGENIWWSTEPFLRHDLKSVIRDFYNEKPFYDFNSLWCRPGEMCGHYTQ